MVTFKTGDSAPYIDEGWYTATLNDLEERESQNPQFPAPQVIWHFGLKDETGNEVENEAGFPVDFWVFTSQSVGKKSNARPIAEALLGTEIEGMSGDEIATAVIGHSCKVKIGDYYRENGEFGGSRPVKGSWRALEKQPAPAARRGPPSRPVPPERSVARSGSRPFKTVRELDSEAAESPGDYDVPF